MNEEALENFKETRFIPTYIKLIKWMVENNIKKEDLAMACKIFLLTK
ncbi:hypothetical protein ACQV2T_06595 [Facklamia sp. P13069]